MMKVFLVARQETEQRTGRLKFDPFEGATLDIMGGFGDLQEQFNNNLPGGHACGESQGGGPTVITSADGPGPLESRAAPAPTKGALASFFGGHALWKDAAREFISETAAHYWAAG